MSTWISTAPPPIPRATIRTARWCARPRPSPTATTAPTAAPPSRSRCRTTCPTPRPPPRQRNAPPQPRLAQRGDGQLRDHQDHPQPGAARPARSSVCRSRWWWTGPTPRTRTARANTPPRSPEEMKQLTALVQIGDRLRRQARRHGRCRQSPIRTRRRAAVHRLAADHHGFRQSPTSCAWARRWCWRWSRCW